MAKFNKGKGTGKTGRSGSRRASGSDERGSGGPKKEYKAKRSFSKNKSYREKKEDAPFARGGQGDRPSKPGFKRGFVRKPERSGGGDSEKKFVRGEDKPRRSGKPEGEGRPYRSHSERDETSDRTGSRERKERPGTQRAGRYGTPESGARSTGRSRSAGTTRSEEPGSFRKERSREGSAEEKGPKRRFSKPRPEKEEREGSRRVGYGELEEGKAFSRPEKRSEDRREKKKQPAKSTQGTAEDGLIRLNKYLANAGISSRREADNLIQSGTVKVNGVVVDQLGYKIKPGDKVTYGDAAVKSERKVYLLLNKPKDYITTVDDPQERKTVMELIKGACRERIYPVGRLDRNTTGLLLFTNDGELTTKLTHPKYGIKKVYHVTLNKGLKPDDFKALVDGIELEDGYVKADDLAFVGEGKKEVGIEIHSGRNRIVRRMFEHLGYDVLKLDRVVFAGLTKKDLPRGKHRFLTAKEVSFLQMIG